MTVFRGRRGFDNFSILLTIFAMIALTLILVSVTIKYNNLSKTFNTAGSNAVNLLGVYETADGALLYLDSAARMSAEKAAYETGMSGFNGGVKVNNAYYSEWSSGSASANIGDLECKASFSRNVPSDYGIFEGYFKLALNEHIVAYNGLGNAAKLATSNHNIELSQVSGRLEVLGTASSPITVSGKNVDYKVMPSFREWINLDLVGDFNKITEKANAIAATGDTKLVASDIQGAIDSYNKEADSNLVWDVAFDSSCSNKCELKIVDRSCYKCRDESHEEEVCNPNDPKDCKKITVANTICDTQGEKSHMYCRENAKISVKVADGRYEKGLRGFVSASGFFPYEYRFGLNWVEMQGIECCNRNGCSTYYSDVLIP